jgi:uncharacterized protein YbbK (DUF523 family)
MTKPLVVVSSCLDNEKVRYNGQDSPSKIVASLVPFVEYKKVCPETAIGLGVPREPIRIVKVGDELRLIKHTTNRDVTKEMNEFTRSFLENLGEVDGFILKSRSPTMGLKGIKIYSGLEDSSVIGRCSGFFAGSVEKKYPGLPIEDEGRLINKRIREHFLTRLFLFARFREAKKEHRLKEFNEENAVLFRFYNSKIADELDFSAENYLEFVKKTVEKPPSSVQVYDFFKGYENTVAKRSNYQALLEKYQINKISFDTLKEVLGVLVTDEKLLRSSFFNPFPRELREDAEADRDEDYWLFLS